MLRAFLLVSLVALVRCTSEPILFKKCPENERYVKCVGCQNTCAVPDIAARCRAICQPGCVCREGWFRNSKGTCVPPEKCDSCGPGEVFSSSGKTECVDTCAQPNKSKTCKPERPIAGCICVDGTIRNKDNVCVDPRACSLSCGPNEFINNCGDGCRRTCANKDEQIACTLECRPPECACKPEFVRGWDDKCILPSQCPTCSGPNEIYKCNDTPCQTTCATLGDQCDIIPIKCVEGCYCKDGFARDDKGVCIPIDKCPPRQCPSDPNAIIVPCGDPCPTTCENKDDTRPRPCPRICIRNGCKCKEGYVLGKDKKCILAKDCPPKVCPTDPNAMVVPCGDPCPTTCENKDDVGPRACPAICKINGCKCNDGFVLGKDGKCILAKDCPPKQCPTDPNAIVLPCGDPCPTTCDNKDDPSPRPCPKICKVNGCKCKNGFVLGKNGKCIPTKDCPTPETKCKENEVFNPCVKACPPETTCDSYFKGIVKQCVPCADCKPGCVCKGGYIRNVKNKCVTPPECCTDPNSFMIAGPNPCNGGTCAKPTFENCNKKRDPFGCQCKDGYVKRSEKDQTCVLLKSCPKLPCNKK